MLRLWQKECSALALNKYESGQSHFLCQATPGGGKTYLASEIAYRLLDKGLIDLILCFSPSKAIATGIEHTFSNRLNCTFSGSLGSLGQSLTYQSIQYLPESFWQTLSRFKIFVILDEIHHCAGGENYTGNTWGEQILKRIQDLATFTLAMSGTPWRSDALPITLANYSDAEGNIQVDYQYSLKQAVSEKVCRSPNIVLIDNENLLCTSDNKEQSYSSISELLTYTKTSYQSVIYNKNAMEHILQLACQNLADIRTESPNAGGLIVAASVPHAQTIVKILSEQFEQSVAIVTYRHTNPIEIINSFREDSTQWIVSVGMISEGTDIPRLQVCCHMSLIKTELYFRQVLGRILRVNSAINQQAWLYTFAEKNLTEFAERIEEDIPNCCSYIRADHVFEFKDTNTQNKCVSINTEVTEQIDIKIDWDSQDLNKSPMILNTPTFDEVTMGQFTERVISTFKL